MSKLIEVSPALAIVVGIIFGYYFTIFAVTAVLVISVVTLIVVTPRNEASRFLLLGFAFWIYLGLGNVAMLVTWLIVSGGSPEFGGAIDSVKTFFQTYFIRQ